MNEGPMDKAIKAARQATGDIDNKIESASELEDEIATCEGLISEIEELTDDEEWTQARDKLSDLEDSVGRIRVYVEGKIE